MLALVCPRNNASQSWFIFEKFTPDILNIFSVTIFYLLNNFETPLEQVK